MKKTNKEGIVQQSDTHTHILPYIDNKNKLLYNNFSSKNLSRKTEEKNQAKKRYK